MQQQDGLGSRSLRSIFNWHRVVSLLVAGLSIALSAPGCGGGGGNSGGSNNNGGALPDGTVGPANVYVGTTLTPGYNMGVNTSGGLTNWVTNVMGDFKCTYPANQDWGAVFITAGTPVATVGTGTYYNFSSYTNLLIDLKGAVGGESVKIGVTTQNDPNNGMEPLYTASNLTTSWQTIQIPLTTDLVNANYPATRFADLYVVCELVFGDNAPETISFRNVRYQ